MKKYDYSGKSAAVIGAGGLGCAALYCLAAAGVGRITVADGDIVEKGNLDRQLLYGFGDIGKSKALLAAARLCGMYPELAVSSIPERINEDNVSQVLHGQDIVLTCVDSIASRLTVNRAAAKLRIPLVDAGISGGEGRLTAVIFGVTPCLECLLSGASGVSEPACGYAAVAAGAMQAGLALRLLAGEYSRDCLGMTVFDIESGSMEQLNVKRTEGCTVCGDIE